jgi:excinuclease ABC subunit B
MSKFKLKSSYHPTADQSNAIRILSTNIKEGINCQVLLGVTGSGKTFTMASVIENLQRPALIISHNKTLAGQLYQEFRNFFPKNSVNYFVSYYDYYQPEAYLPSTDTYIEKDADINELIDKLRLATTANLQTRPDNIVVASVSCIYNIGSPLEYKKHTLKLQKGDKLERKQIINKLVELQYEREDFGFYRGTFRVRGNIIDVHPAYQDEAIRLKLDGEKIKEITKINPVSGQIITSSHSPLAELTIYPAKHYITDTKKNKAIFTEIRQDLTKRIKQLTKENKMLEAQRLKQKVTYDLEMIQEIGYVKGIENYSRYFDNRSPGEAPFTLLDHFSTPFNKEWLVFIDESHITIPQIRGMHAGDQARKKTLVDYGFRLPSAFDNRPLVFDEFMRRIPGFIAASATPGDWEISMAKEAGSARGIVEQLLRPTGIPDPEIEIRPTKNQVANIICEVAKRSHPKRGAKRQRTLITTLTKQTAEDLAEYMAGQKILVQYLHSDIKTLERTDILDHLRRGKYDCLVGVNLLREGLDLPEVSLVAILDADKEGFLRSEVSLIQTMGRAARHVDGKVILYADQITNSIKRAISEVNRRRKYQLKMNKKMGITPKSIVKPILEKLIDTQQDIFVANLNKFNGTEYKKFQNINVNSLTPMDRKILISRLRREMRLAAQDLNFELAADIRDKIRDLES